MMKQLAMAWMAICFVGLMVYAVVTPSNTEAIMSVLAATLNLFGLILSFKTKWDGE